MHLLYIDRAQSEMSVHIALFTTQLRDYTLYTGCGPKYRHARRHPPTLSPEDSDAAASAAHAPYTRLCAAEAAEA